MSTNWLDLSSHVSLIFLISEYRAKEKTKESAQKKDPSRRLSRKSACGGGSIMECCARATSSDTHWRTQQRRSAWARNRSMITSCNCALARSTTLISRNTRMTKLELCALLWSKRRPRTRKRVFLTRMLANEWDKRATPSHLKGHQLSISILTDLDLPR